MRVFTTTFHGNQNVGLYGYCAEVGEERLCILGERLNRDDEQNVARALGAELHHIAVAGTPMPGVFLAGNRKALLVPGIAFQRELRNLQHLGLPVQVFETHLTCLGNNILANDTGCLVNPDFSDAEIRRLHTLLGVPVKRIRIAGLHTPGACVVLNGRFGIIHRDANESEIATVRQALGLESLEPASVNLGSPYVRAGIIASSHGFVISSQSGGPEIVHIEQSLGYLEGKR
jgi:putative translation initiation factor eIF-6